MSKPQCLLNYGPIPNPQAIFRKQYSFKALANVSALFYEIGTHLTANGYL